MHTVVKISLALLVLVLSLAAVALALLVYRPEIYLGAVNHLLHERAGYRVTADNIDVELSPARISTKGLTLRNPAWENRAVLLEVQTARLLLEPMRALGGEAPFWSLEASGADIYLERNAKGELNWQTGGPADQGEPVTVNFERIRVDQSRIHYRTADSDQTLVMNRFEAKRQGARSVSLEGRGAYRSEPVNLQGRLSLPARQSKELNLDLSASGLGLQVSAKGRVDINDLATTSLKADVQSRSLEALEQFLATRLPNASPVDVSLELEGRDAKTVAINLDGTMSEQPVKLSGTVARAAPRDNAALLQVDLEARALGVTARTDGLVNLAEPGRDTDARVSAQADGFQQLEKALRANLPELAPFEIAMHVKGDRGAYAVESLKLEAAANALSGSGRYDPEARALEVKLDARKIRLAPLQARGGNGGGDSSGQEAAKPGPAAEAPLNWQWLRGARATIDVAVDELWSRDYLFQQLQAHIEVVDGKVSIAPVAARVGARTNGTEQKPALTERLTLNGTLAPLGERTEGKDVSVDLEISGADMSLRVAGEANLNGFDQQSLEVDGSARKLDAPARLLNADIGFLAPAKLHAKIQGGKNNATIDPLSIAVQDSDASGRFQFDWSGEKLRIGGELSSRNLDIDRLRPVDPEDVPKEPDPDTPVFSDEPLDLEWMDTLSLDLAARFGKLIVNRTTFRNVLAKAVLDDSGLSVDPFKGDLTEGGVRGRLQMARASGGVEFKSNLNVVNLSPADLGEPGKGFLDGGYTDLDIDISGRGATPHEIAASLNGDLVAEIRGATIRNDMFEMIGSDLLMELVSSIVPFVKKDDVTQLECAAFHFTAKDGVLSSDKQLFLETSKMKVIGGGFINLGTEKLEIGFSPKARSGVGVSVGTLAKFVRIGGTLSNPKPETDPEGLLKSGATIGAAAATGGVSLLVQGLIDRVTSEGTECGQIFSKEAEVPEAIESDRVAEDKGGDSDDGEEDGKDDAGPQDNSTDETDADDGARMPNIVR